MKHWYFLVWLIKKIVKKLGFVSVMVLSFLFEMLAFIIPRPYDIVAMGMAVSCVIGLILYGIYRLIKSAHNEYREEQNKVIDILKNT